MGNAVIPGQGTGIPGQGTVIPGQGTGRRRLGRLPAETTSFVGRAAELSAISALLTSARLVTVVGPAGVGKTRLCLRAAAQSAGRFPDGVWLVELSGLRDPAQLYDAVALVLGVPSWDGRAGSRGPRTAAILDHLRDRRLALILDTCEHLVDACAEFAETVLRGAPAVTLLATSRQPLHAPGEHACPVPPLDPSGDAAELFAQRAAAVMPGFEVTPASRADVVRLCRRLDGIPLAIELAAVRLRALPLPDLADRLGAGFGLLAAGRRGTAERHATLRTAVEWSYDLCTPAERSLWGRLSVFAGPFDVAAVEEVCSGGGHCRAEAFGALIGLVDKSVVLRCGPGENRYRLLGAVRAFGAEKLAAEPGQDRARVLGLFTARYLSMAAHFDQGLLGEDQAASYRRLRREHVNIGAALEYALGDDSRLAPQGAALAIGLHAYWQMSGLLGEGRRWLGRVLGLFAPHSPEHALALGVSGRLAALQGDTAAALDEIGESIRLARELGEPLAEARGYCNLNLALTFAGSHPGARAAGETARQLMAACGDRVGLICLEAQMGHLHQLAGDVGAAVECCERGLALLGSSKGECWFSSYLHLIIGFALFQRPGRSQECADTTRRALAAKHAIGDVAGSAYALEVLGWLAARGRRFDEAALLLGAAEPLWQRTPGRLSGIAIMEQTRERVVEKTRGALSDRRYEAAYAQGAAMPLADVVRRAAAGSQWLTSDCASTALTRREQEIAVLVADGLSNREVAAALFIAKRTVDAHVEHIFGKLEISSRVQLTVWLRSAGNAAGATG